MLMCFKFRNNGKLRIKHLQIRKLCWQAMIIVIVDKAYSGDKFNRAGSEINWTVTAEVIEGVARNAKVHVDFSSNMEYVSCNKTIGEYDPSTRIWDIGDLSGSQSATLIILTRLKSDGHFNLTANATTDSIDINLLNNAVTKNTKSGTGNNGSKLKIVRL